MSDDMIERVARAIAQVQLFSRYNDWTSDRVHGYPIEICRYGIEGEAPMVVVQRFAGDPTEETGRLHQVIRSERARAAIKAMREPTNGMCEAGSVGPLEATPALPAITTSQADAAWSAMIDAALARAEASS